MSEDQSTAAEDVAERRLRARVGNAIAALRATRKLTQEGLAGLASRSHHTISALERGLALPSFQTLVKLADVFGVPVADIIGHGKADDSEARNAMLTKLIAVARELPDEDLAVALAQITALSNRGNLRG